MRSVHLVALATVSLLWLRPAPAHGCWDGYSVSAERVTFTGEGTAGWNVEQVRELATWARRLQVLLGPQGALESDMGYATACIGGRCADAVAHSMRPRELFSAVATALQVPWRQRALALRVTAAPYAVQVAALRDRAQAEVLARRLSELDLPMGSVEIGGFPADNPEANVVDAVDTEGRAVYRVVVGTFLDRAEASAHTAEIAERTGLPTLLRAL